jgi:hypothetical protein
MLSIYGSHFSAWRSLHSLALVACSELTDAALESIASAASASSPSSLTHTLSLASPSSSSSSHSSLATSLVRLELSALPRVTSAGVARLSACAALEELEVSMRHNYLQ